MNRLWGDIAAETAGSGPAAPYPGLRPFLVGEADLFFGREQMADEVLVRLNERHMVVVHGSSGCGKSSLVAAGVLPQLTRRRARRGLTLSVGSFRPGNKPMQSLVATVAGLVAGGTGPDHLRDVYAAIAQRDGARTALARLAKSAGIDQLCIVVDQFEELFRFAEEESFEEAQRFAEVLVALTGLSGRPANWWQEEPEEEAALPDEAQVSLLLTMRSEFLGDCARFPGLADAINRTQYLLPNMERADLIRAIREPAEVFGGTVEHGLAERMADDAEREQDSLPLVQHALMKLWRSSPEGTLTLAAYEKAVEDSGQPEALRQKSPLGAILAGHADGVLEAIAAGDRERLSAAGHIFRALTRKDSEGRAIRCPQRLSRLESVSGVPAETTGEIVDAFRREGVSFLTPYQALQEKLEPDTIVDISHEALIRTWPRMSDRTIDPEDAQPVGWVEREAQEAMLWRWVVLHADFFAKNSSAYLDGTTTDRIGAWFETLQRRPEWVRPYLLHPTGKADVREEPEWKSVKHLLDESRRRTWIERTMLRRWKKLGRWSLVLLAVTVLAAAVAGWKWLEARERDAAAHELQEASREVAHGLYVANNVIRERSAKRLPGSDSRKDELILPQVVAAAAGTARGTIITTMPGGQDAAARTAYIWIGRLEGDGGSNLLTLDRQPVAISAVRAGARYRLGADLVLRQGWPDESYTPDVAIGLATREAIVEVVAGPRGFGERSDHWIAVVYNVAELPQVTLTYANDHVAASELAAELRGLGYAVQDSESAAASGHTVRYCGGDADAARMLAQATSITLSRLSGYEAYTVAPVEDCTNAAPGRLHLQLDLRPAAT